MLGIYTCTWAIVVCHSQENIIGKHLSLVCPCRIGHCDRLSRNLAPSSLPLPLPLLPLPLPLFSPSPPSLLQAELARVEEEAGEFERRFKISTATVEQLLTGIYIT